ncbi:MAG: DEAD/DEAH box helicase [Spirochaetales bacterium]|jgi:DEAD/DEAH box helicase domain-containing protein|nr:DEAD/DEAH box helicase [Spirochaetales bacterium]
MDERQAELTSVLEELKADPSFMSCVTRWEKIPPRPGEYRDFPSDLNPLLREALLGRGIQRLYSHQARAYEAVKEGKNLVVVTPTASGKTLCYNLPILQHLLSRPNDRALYLFPTKALSQDQQAELNALVQTGLPLRVSTYDGDTPQSLRISAREKGRIVISNPDMFHGGILPNHPKWIKFLSSLAFVVIDEIHIYRGVFGSHMINLIRRLKRVLSFYNCRPVFICCSATIGNPAELARRILEEEVLLIDTNGAPAGEKHIILYNPPLVDQVQGIRRGLTTEAQRIALKFLKRKIKTIIFARSRIRTELIASYINQSLANYYNNNRGIRVESYRGGYLPSERREIERGLREGEIQGVVSTNALELGIDIGGLDVSILSGFPSSIASAWQQAGRSGRQAGLSASFLIASSAPVDQYLAAHPDYFFSRSPEDAYVDPDNIYLLMDHLKCAVFELPFKEGDSFGRGSAEGLALLEEEGVVRRTAGRWYWSDRSYPAEQISLRSLASENVIIIDRTLGKDEVIGEMDKRSAKELIFDDAVYLHRGEQYQVQKLDLDSLKCYVIRSEVNFYTDGLVKSDLHVLKEDLAAEKSGLSLILGDVLVRSQVTKYKKLKFHSGENIGYGDIYLPEDEMHTRGLLLVMDPRLTAGRIFRDFSPPEQQIIISRLGGLVKTAALLFILCDRRDIGLSERLKDPHTGFPTLYFYDNQPGGTGLCEGLLEHLPQALRAARELPEGCPCEAGCPSCIGAPDPGDPESNPKGVLKRFLAAWIGEA